MRKPEGMTDTDVYNWIFLPDPKDDNKVRWSWVDDCLMGDLRTYQLGIELRSARPYIVNYEGRQLGGGNYSLPVLITTALEFLARLYSGDMVEKGSDYVVGLNVARYAKSFFRGYYRQVPATLWSTVRNGLHHLFHPKIKHGKFRFAFGFGIDSHCCSHLSRDGDSINVLINSIEYLHALERSVLLYRDSLAHSTALQWSFFRAYTAVTEGRWEGKHPTSLHKRWFSKQESQEEKRLDGLHDGDLRLLFSETKLRRRKTEPSDEQEYIATQTSDGSIYWCPGDGSFETLHTMFEIMPAYTTTNLGDVFSPTYHHGT